MSGRGDPERDLLVRSRSALLDALQALESQSRAVIVVGAQAVYLRTSSATVALAEATKDGDLALDPRSLQSTPLIEQAMRAAGFEPDPLSRQPGALGQLGRHSGRSHGPRATSGSGWSEGAQRTDPSTRPERNAPSPWARGSCGRQRVDGGRGA